MAQGIVVSNDNDQLYCSKCHKTMRAVNFYQYRDGSKCELCKSCLTMHINNTDPDTFMWILEKFDVPWIENEWNTLYEKAYQKDPYKITGMSVLGKYLAKMKLKQWKMYTYADTEKIAEENRLKAEQQGTPMEQMESKVEEMRKAFENGEINEAQWLTYKSIIEPAAAAPELPPPETPELPELPPMPDPYAKTNTNDFYPVNQHPFVEVELPDVEKDLTEEDKIYLATKWGRLYSAENWVYLEKKYNDFMASFDIKGAAREDTLIQICKLSLKLNEALDSGDMDSYAKLVRAYDSLMKSAKFTEAQNKEDASSEFDSVGAIVSFCEKEGGYIPEYKITADQDIIDSIIRDNREYLQTLIKNDTSLAQQIEQFIKKQEILMEKRKEREEASGIDPRQIELTEEDYAEFFDAIEEDKKKDAELLTNEEKENEK